jgi:hypothetical protein
MYGALIAAFPGERRRFAGCVLSLALHCVYSEACKTLEGGGASSIVMHSSCMLRCVVCRCCWMGDGAARPMQGRNERERAGETGLKADFLHCGNAAGVRRAAGVFALIMASWACMRAFAWQCAWAPEGLTASSTLKGMHSIAQIAWQSVVCTVHHKTGVTHVTWPA